MAEIVDTTDAIPPTCKKAFLKALKEDPTKSSKMITNFNSFLGLFHIDHYASDIIEAFLTIVNNIDTHLDIGFYPTLKPSTLKQYFNGLVYAMKNQYVADMMGQELVEQMLSFKRTFCETVLLPLENVLNGVVAFDDGDVAFDDGDVAYDDVDVAHDDVDVAPEEDGVEQDIASHDVVAYDVDDVDDVDVDDVEPDECMPSESSTSDIYNDNHVKLRKAHATLGILSNFFERKNPNTEVESLSLLISQLIKQSMK